MYITEAVIIKTNIHNHGVQAKTSRICKYEWIHVTASQLLDTKLNCTFRR